MRCVFYGAFVLLLTARDYASAGRTGLLARVHGQVNRPYASLDPVHASPAALFGPSKHAHESPEHVHPFA